MNYIKNYGKEILSISLFENIKYFLKIKYNLDKKISRNWIGLLHASGIILFSGSYIFLNYYEKDNTWLYNLMKTFSFGYFLNDSLFILRYEKLTPLNLGYLYHHFATCYLLNIGPKLYADKFIFWGELSNIPIYFIYYYIKKEKLTFTEECKLACWKQTQKVLYTGIRIPILGYYTYLGLKSNNDFTDKLFVTPLYLMGFLWSCKILLK
jgi:hypothetical protein